MISSSRDGLRTEHILSANRLFRGLLQGFMLARFLPDVHALGWSIVAAGSLLSGSLLADFALTLLVGHRSDRLPPKRLLMTGEVLSVASGTLFFLHPSPFSLAVAILLAGAGQRSNGSPGPWAPAEQTILSRTSPGGETYRIFSHNTFWGLSGMAAGAFAGMEAPAAGHPLVVLRFAMLALIFLSLVNILLLLRLPDRPAGAFSARGLEKSGRLTSREHWNLSLVVSSNLFYGLSIGMADAMISYWFVLKFHGSPQQISSLLALSFLASAGLARLLGNLPDRLKAFSYVLLQLSGLIGIALLPGSTSLWSAGLLTTLRIMSVRAPGGLRQALVANSVRPARSGWSAGLHFSSLHLLQAAGPLLTGYFWESHRTGTPLVLSAAFMAVSLFLTIFLYVRTSSPEQRECPDQITPRQTRGPYERRRSENASNGT
ncbi:major facilitator superfamily MFS_1 [Leptospirillum ferriphilum]|uniref:Major facilitator superfamily MFS_1 n=1 Tax=Leptospirillum ferriphilum TaxID=178606 RepID=A0A094YLW8_9BACT|nr:MFS transporter [Leptospirillum ferriphilum]KGA94226.1 major facilitator superfamily MFS_1 [Leptospirillum ferriphilum]